eukprot:TRINITY_DN4375_c0_g1_i1.p1 TRINITY_DN4375_c0_g1~~TRINITY_DN4375_c0_g1_i1.p1  ORF type:complete len:579 (-),score=214.69 TRINITY_DN4375_c0_g1_i1:245-1981(-)
MESTSTSSGAQQHAGGHGSRPRPNRAHQGLGHALHGERVPVIHYAPLNKGVGFTGAERSALRVRGLLPPRPVALSVLVANALAQLREIERPLDKYVFLQSLFDYDEALFFRLLMDNVTEIMPLVYTPVVGLACQNYSKIYRKTRGLFLSIHDQGSIAEVVAQWPQRDVRVIVVTDGERILGLGDLGCNGMGIPVGKLMLYTACAGVDPRYCLPVVIDVGTENEKNLADPLYIGNQHRRVRGPRYDAFVEECLMALDRRFNHPLIQFEDFGNNNAFRLLEHYKPRICTFNDDIEGTASVALAGVLATTRITKRPLDRELFLFSGAGEAGLGIAELICAALHESCGVALEEARRRCWFVDSRGLVVRSRLPQLAEHKKKFAHEHAPCRTLLEAIDALKPTALVGVSGVGGVFSREVIERMAALNERPVIFALSNPTSHAECTAEEAYRFSGGRAIFASGSPFDPVELDGKTFVPGQGNNSYIFPAVGFAVMAVQAKHVSEQMFLVAARALADTVAEADLAAGLVYPPLHSIRAVSLEVAEAVAAQAYREGVCGVQRPSNLRAFLQRAMYEPRHDPPRSRL